MDDAEVQKQLNRMVAFIEQEVQEKVEEIEVRADAEFNLEKGRIIQEQRIKTNTHNEMKEKRVKIQRKIQASKVKNEERLKILKVQEDHVTGVYDDARKCLIQGITNYGLYKNILKKLIMQGLLQMLEKNVTLRIREVDVSVVQKLVDEVAVEYKTQTNMEVHLKLDTYSFLATQTCGGVELLAQKNKIKICNTLQSRLELIAQQLKPAVRTALFGCNPNRRFQN